MDEDVEELERALRQDPGDREAAARLKAALLRAGRRDELAARYRLGFVCDVRWDDMRQLNPGGRARRCDRCSRDVHAADSYAEFDRLAAAGHCVAVSPVALPVVVEGLVDAPGGGPVRGPQDPCLVERPPEPAFAPPPPMRLAGAPMPIFMPPPLPPSAGPPPPPAGTPPPAEEPTR